MLASSVKADLRLGEKCSFDDDRGDEPRNISKLVALHFDDDDGLT